MSERNLSEGGTQFSLGKLIRGRAERDAVHIAVAPVIAAENLHAGEKLRFVYGSTTMVKSAHESSDWIGVVDPYLNEMWISKNQQFYMFLKPNTIVGLRHEWTHPAFETKPPVNDSEKWLREFADKWNFNYDYMISEAQNPEGYVVAQGIDLHSKDELGEDEALFWFHLRNLTNFNAPPEHRENFGWSCSC